MCSIGFCLEPLCSIIVEINSIICNDDGAVELYNDNSRKLRTYSDGVKIASDANTGRLVLEDTSGNYCYQLTGYDVASAGAGGRATFQDSTGAVVLDMRASGGNIFSYNTLKMNGNSTVDNLKLVFGAGSDFELYHDGNYNILKGIGAHSTQFWTTNTPRWRIQAGGHLMPETNNTYDVGTSSYGVKDIYVETSIKMSGAAPLQFEHNSNTTSAKKTVIYANYNNTSNHAYNGLLVEMGHVTDSLSGEVRKFTIGERGGHTNAVIDQNGIHFTGGSSNPTLNADNGLDDYEEGSFSPTLVNGNNGYRFQQGTYTKVGNLVSFTAYIETSATPPSGNLAFGGLPFASIGSRSWVFPFHTNRTSFGTASFDARAYLGGTDTNVYIYYPVNSSSSNFQPIDQNGMNAANASAVWISGSYQTSA